MKIEKITISKCFCEIPPGTVFKDDSNYYMKIPHEGKQNAVNVSTGTRTFFNEDDEIDIVDAVLRVDR